jgi:myo-inositol-1(or 4)-monophosphatase
MIKNTLFKAIQAGANELTRYFNGTFTINSKATINDLVTEADHASERAIFEVIQQAHPEHFILSEETGAIPSHSNIKWIIDPIDGTINFANGIPICCVSIGVEENGEMLMGAVFNPFMNEMFFAEKGKGAFLNDKPIKVSDKDNLLTSCLVTGFPYQYLDAENGPLEIFEKLIRKSIPVRRLGSAALDLCWTAAGRFDGFYEHKLQAWDSAAGYLIVQEAGGIVTDLNGEKYNPYQPGIIATNGKIQDQLLALLKGGSL